MLDFEYYNNIIKNSNKFSFNIFFNNIFNIIKKNYLGIILSFIPNLCMDFNINKTIDFYKYLSILLNLLIPKIINDLNNYLLQENEIKTLSEEKNPIKFLELLRLNLKHIELELPKNNYIHDFMNYLLEKKIIYILNKNLEKNKNKHKTHSLNNSEKNNNRYTKTEPNILYHFGIVIDNIDYDFFMISGIESGWRFGDFFNNNEMKLKKIIDYICSQYHKFSTKNIKLYKLTIDDDINNNEKKLKISLVKTLLNNYDNIILSNKHINQLNIRIKNFLNEKYIEKLNLLGFENKLHIHLTRIPGSGKTSLAFSIAQKLNKNILLINNKNIENFLNNISILNKQNDDFILLFDEIDFFDLKEKQIKIKNGNIKINNLLAHLLDLLNGNLVSSSVIIFTSNITENFNKALFRDGRIHLTLEMNEFNDITIFDNFFKIIYNDIDWKNQFDNNQINKLILYKFSLATLSEIAKENLSNCKNFINKIKQIINEN